MKKTLLNLYYLHQLSWVWKNKQKWLGKISFDDFVNDKPEVEDSTDKSLDEDEVVNLVHMKNDTQEESNEEEGGESWGSDESKVTNKTSGFLSVPDQQKAFLRWYALPTDLVDQLE